MSYYLRVDYVGHADEWDEMIVDGDTSKPEFIAYYVKDDSVLAAAGCKRDKQTSAMNVIRAYAEWV